MPFDILILSLIALSNCPIDYDICEADIDNLQYNASLIQDEDKSIQYFTTQVELIQQGWNLIPIEQEMKTLIAITLLMWFAYESTFNEQDDAAYSAFDTITAEQLDYQKQLDDKRLREMDAKYIDRLQSTTE